MKQIVISALVAATVAAVPAQALAADDSRWSDGSERQRAAFAGAVVRLELDRRAAPRPVARLGFGFADYRRGATGVLTGGGAILPFEAGIAGGRLEYFIGGEPGSQIERRLGATGTGRTLLIIGGIVVVAGAAVLLMDGNDDQDGPCPPGVEVCAAQ